MFSTKISRNRKCREASVFQSNFEKNPARANGGRVRVSRITGRQWLGCAVPSSTDGRDMTVNGTVSWQWITTDKDINEAKEYFEEYGIPTQVAHSLSPPEEPAEPHQPHQEQFADDDAPALPAEA